MIPDNDDLQARWEAWQRNTAELLQRAALPLSEAEAAKLKAALAANVAEGETLTLALREDNGAIRGHLRQHGVRSRPKLSVVKATDGDEPPTS